MNEDNRYPPITNQNSPGTAAFEIKIQEYLDENWSDWLGGMTLAHNRDKQTLLTGLVPDQSALLSVLLKLNDLGLHLVSVRRIHDCQSAAA